jgi:hypothetical protein
MDFAKQQAEGAGVVGSIIGCLCSCGCLAAVITFAVYCGIYAFNNPDPNAWYEAGIIPASGQLVGVMPNTMEGVTPVHEDFVRWFTWTFANQMVFFGFPIIAGVTALITGCSPGLGKCFGGLSGCALMCSGLVAWIMGMVWRFSEAGRYSSGDYLAENEAAGPYMQIQSGKFMGIYYLITWILLGVSCGCSILGAIVTACCK